MRHQRIRDIARYAAQVRRRVCARKRQYHSRAEAELAITQLALDGRDIARLRSYSCPYGRHWHIGHARKEHGE